MDPQSLRLKPYPELKGRWLDPESRELELKTPWVRITAEVDAEWTKTVEAVFAHLDGGPEPEFLEAFLGHFSAYPIAFVKPESRGMPRRSPRIPAEKTRPRLADPMTLATSALTSETVRDLSEAPRPLWESWELDLDSVLSHAAWDQELYDPLAALTAIRHLRLKRQHCHPDEGLRLEALSNGPVETFREAVGRLLRQTLHITSHCESSVSPAIECFSFATQEVEGFLNEERGHDSLILHSLEALKTERPARENPVHPAIHAMMELLRYAATNHFLGFAALIDAFEGIDYTTRESPLGALIRKLPEGVEAARGIEAHYRINRGGGHGQVGLELASIAGPQSPEEVAAALRLVELHTRLKAAGLRAQLEI